MSSSATAFRWNPFTLPFEYMGLAPGRPDGPSTTRPEGALLLGALITGGLLGIELVDGVRGWILAVGLAYGLCVVASAVLCWRHARRS